MKPQDYKNGEYPRSSKLDEGANTILFAGLSMSAIFGLTALVISTVVTKDDCETAKDTLDLIEIIEQPSAKDSKMDREQLLSPYCD